MILPLCYIHPVRGFYYIRHTSSSCGYTVVIKTTQLYIKLAFYRRHCRFHIMVMNDDAAVVMVSGSNSKSTKDNWTIQSSSMF